MLDLESANEALTPEGEAVDRGGSREVEGGRPSAKGGALASGRLAVRRCPMAHLSPATKRRTLQCRTPWDCLGAPNCLPLASARREPSSEHATKCVSEHRGCVAGQLHVRGAPPFQREYSWRTEVEDFWNDLKTNIDSDYYFLGLIILTEESRRRPVVDGQQRLITLSLLAIALYHEAIRSERIALADRIQADFLNSIDYDSDEITPRLILSDKADNDTFQAILKTGRPPPREVDADSVSGRLIKSYEYLSEKLRDDLAADPFKRLGKWTEFLSQKVYFAVFIHPDSTSAYQVYEVVNTRGRELTTADLLKNYILSQTAADQRDARYREWQQIAKQFAPEGNNNFVQYIRHAVTVDSGHVLPKDLFGFLARRVTREGKEPPTPGELMHILQEHLPLYLQMIDPTLAGPAKPEALGVFSALNSLGVIAVRPILLAVAECADAEKGMDYVLRLVVRRIIVGNLGTGNVERRFGEAAKNVHTASKWEVLTDELRDLNPNRDDFVDQLRRRSFNKGVLSFLRRSIIEETPTPDVDGVLFLIWTDQASDWKEMSEEDGLYWGSTIGNTFLSTIDRRARESNDWAGFKANMLPTAVNGEWCRELERFNEWNAHAVEAMGRELAHRAGQIWY